MAEVLGNQIRRLPIEASGAASGAGPAARVTRLVIARFGAPGKMRISMIYRAIVKIFSFLKEHHLRGRGLLLRGASRLFPFLTHYPVRFAEFPEPVPIDLGNRPSFALFEYALYGMEEKNASLVRHMEKFLRPGGCLWDVGANVGIISLYFSNPRCSLSRIDMFEPNPALIPLLEEIFSRQKIAKIHQIALGKEDQILPLNIEPQETCTASLVHAFRNSGQCEVRVRRGDACRKELGSPVPDVIKIDVEGFEQQVLEGLTGTIETHRPVIFFEHLFMSDADIRNAIPKGYAAYFIKDTGELTARYEERREGANAVLVPAEKKNLLMAQ